MFILILIMILCPHFLLAENIDSLRLRGYSNGTFDIFLNSKGDLFIAQQNTYDGALGYSPIIKGLTKKSRVEQKVTQQIFDLINNIVAPENLQSITDSCNLTITHTPRAFFNFYQKGKQQASIAFYDNYEHSKRLSTLYQLVKKLTATKQLKPWDTTDLDIKLIEEVTIDSIVIYEYEKITKYIRGVKKVNIQQQKNKVLINDDKDQFLAKINNLKKVNPLKDGSYEHIEEQVHYWLLLFYREGKLVDFFNYDGKYFRKEYYLWFKKTRGINKLLNN